MAKKTVASLQTASKRLSKAIKMVKSPKTGAYTFVESIFEKEIIHTHIIHKLLSFGSSFFIFYIYALSE